MSLIAVLLLMWLATGLVLGLIVVSSKRVQLKPAHRDAQRDLAYVRRTMALSRRTAADAVTGAVQSAHQRAQQTWIESEVDRSIREIHELDMETRRRVSEILQSVPETMSAAQAPAQQLTTEDGYLIPCRCPAWASVRTHTENPNVLATANDQLAQAITPRKNRVDTAQKPCTEGGPCRIGHRRIVRSLQGIRVASLCTRCGKHEYWQPFLDLGVS